ncbi:MAG: hypothetical protein A2Y33_09840 [Spirochaetes bacterium GWF1_51_8]|nr:MAG: hypothetical protein A2Y33_09840 [Spirochaetes bacterium GWF1_51_8]
MKGTRIKVWESDPAVRESFLQAFVPEGINVDISDQSGNILKDIRKELPDLVFIDTLFPGLDWKALCGEIFNNEHTFEVAVVLLFKDADFETLRVAKLAGATDVLIKPFQPYELLIKTENILLFKSRCHMKSNLVASHVGFSVEHYVGQPLTAVLGAVKTLRSLRERGIKPTDDQMRDIIDIIIDGSDELSTVIKKFGKLRSYHVTDRFSNKKIIEFDPDADDGDDGGVSLF